jgi:transcription elongation factor SPT6
MDVPSKKLQDAIEPSVLAERFLGNDDQIIRDLDIPERYQILEGQRQFLGVANEAQLQREASYISEKLQLFQNDEVEAVERVLKYMKTEEEHFLEVPFIYHQRKDYLPSGLLSEAILWDIQRLSLEYQSHQSQLKDLKTLVEKLQLSSQEATEDSVVQLYFQMESHSLDHPETLQDVRRYVQFVFADEIAALDAPHKRRVRPSNFQLMKRAGIEEAAKLFDVDIRAFVTSVINRVKMMNPKDDILPPDMAMDTFVQEASRFSSSDAVVRAAKSMIAEKLAMDPLFRRHLRDEFSARCMVTVTPTDKGKAVITEGHEYYRFKYVRDKPIYEFEQSTQFAKMVKAEDEGLVQLDVFVDDWESQVRNFEGYITSQNYSDSSAQWNRLRKEVLHQALTLLIKDSTKHVREKLLQEAMDTIVNKCAAELRNRLNVAPLSAVSRRHNDHHGEHGPRVMALTWGTGDRDSPTFACVLDATGSLIAHRTFHRLQDRPIGINKEEPVRKREELDNLVDLANVHGVDLVLVAGQTMETTRLFKDISDAVKRGIRDNKIDRTVRVEMALDDTAKAWKSSQSAKGEFGEYPELMRYCVHIGRRVLDPLMAFASLYNWERDLLKVSLNFEQGLVPPERLWERFEQVFMNVVGHVGVDINAALTYPHLRHTMQFVPGLGPRKATGLISALHKENMEFVLARNEIFEQLGANCFFNSASFFIITKHLVGGDDDQIDPLDRTRIHPDDYREARKMVLDALEMEPGEGDDHALDEIAQIVVNPEYQTSVKALNVAVYAERIEQESGKKKLTILRMIIEELCRPYHDARQLHHAPSAQQLFTMLTGDTEDTFHEGTIVDATVRKVLQARAIVEFQNGLESSVFPSDFSKDGDSNDQWLQEKKAIRVKINRVVKEFDEEGIPRFSVDVTANPSVVASTRAVDSRFDQDREKADAKRKLDEQRKQEARQATESLNHPLYRRDWGVEDAEQYLATRDLGELILRPSSTPGNLVAVIKLDNAWYWHLRTFVLGKLMDDRNCKEHARSENQVASQGHGQHV